MTPPDGFGSNPSGADDAKPSSTAEWTVGPSPRPVMGWLMRLSGVDFDLVLKAPLDERQAMARIGAALLLGAAFHGLCVSIAMFGMLGFGVGQAVIAVVVSAMAATIVFLLDCQIVSHDWIAGGRSLCRSRGIVPPISRFEPWQRFVFIVLRCSVSLAVAGLTAWFVLLEAFDADARRELAREHRNANAHIYARVEPRYEELVVDARRYIKSLDSQIEELQRERAALAVPSASEPVVDHSVARLHDEVEQLHSALADARKRAAEYETLADAEEHGIAWTGKTTGLRGKREAWAFYDKQAQGARARAATVEADIATKEKALDLARQAATASAEAAKKAAAERLTTIERTIAELRQTRLDRVAELRALEEGREAWIRAHAMQAPGFVPMPTNLSDRLRVLWALMQKSELMRSIAIGLKAFLVLLECAGPVAALFGSARLYAMRAAMRIEDAVDDEIERREAKEHAAFLRRLRRQEERDEELARRQYPSAANPDVPMAGAKTRECRTVQ